jgi:hypothetical protein
MPSSGSVTSSLRASSARALALSLPLLAILLPGCPKDPAAVALPEAVERRVAAVGDEALRRALLEDSPLPFAVIARFDAPVFPDRAEMLSDAGLPPSEASGSTAVLVATSAEIRALLDEKSLLAIRYLGKQASLARLHPELEIALLRAYDRKAESEPVSLSVRFRSPPEKREDDALSAAGFSISTRGGQAWTIRGPWDRLPVLLGIDEILYVEAASKSRVQ